MGDLDLSNVPESNDGVFSTLYDQLQRRGFVGEMQRAAEKQNEELRRMQDASRAAAAAVAKRQAEQDQRELDRDNRDRARFDSELAASQKAERRHKWELIRWGVTTTIAIAGFVLALVHYL